ncbi:MAG: hypothetical protein K8R79_03710 [Calditrichales bacterium]|nr:hypothetical protein [Calditrichales bacterium]
MRRNKVMGSDCLKEAVVPRGRDGGFFLYKIFIIMVINSFLFRSFDLFIEY